MELRFPATGDVALACYYVKGNWPDASTQPTLDTSGKHMVFSLKFESQVVRDFQELLSKAMTVDAGMAKSARTLKMMLATQLAGKIIPNASGGLPLLEASERA